MIAEGGHLYGLFLLPCFSVQTTYQIKNNSEVHVEHFAGMSDITT